MYHIHYLNKISPKGTELWGEDYTLTDDVAQAEGILVRSAAFRKGCWRWQEPAPV